KEVMGTGRGELERPSRALLSPHLGEIGASGRGVPVLRRLLRSSRLELDLAAEIRDRLREVTNRDGRDARERSLLRRLGRAEQTRDARPAGSLRDGEDAANPAEAPVECELADCSRPLERAARNLSRRRENRERDRQVEARALLAKLGGGEIDGDAGRGELELRCGDPTPDALPRLLAGAVGEPDDREAGDAFADVRLDVDAPRLEADEGVRERAGEHAARLGANS